MVELANLATKLDDNELTDFARDCYENYEEDLDSCEEHREKHAEWLELYHQTHQPDTPPWSGASDTSIPIITEAVNQFQSRGYKALFPSRNFVAALPEDVDSSEAQASAERVGKYLSYKLSKEDRGYKQDKNAMLQAAALHGCDYSKVYYNPLKGKVCVERVRECDLVVPYHSGPCQMDDLERKTHIIPMSMNKAAILVRGKFFSELPTPYNQDNASPQQQAIDDIQGIMPPGQSRTPQVCKILEQHALLDIDGDGIAEPYIIWLDAESKKILRIQIRYEVDERGNAMDDKQPIEYFVKYGFLPNADGFLDNGIGHLLGSLNIAINRMARQIEDAGTLANIGNMSGFISENLGMKGDAVDLELGYFKRLPKTVSNIRDSVYQFQFPGANPSLVKNFEYLVQTAQRVGSTTDAVTGNIEKVLQPLSMMTLLESSLQMPTSVMEQMAVSFEDELNKIYRLEAKYIKGPKRFNDEGASNIVRPEDFSEAMHITPILDPRQMTWQQKIAKAQELYNFSMANPMLAQNPEVVMETTKRILVALDTEDIDKILPPPQKPEDIDNQDMENMYFMLPKEGRPSFDVYEGQNHVEHIHKIDTLVAALNEDMLPKFPTQDEATMQVVMGFTNDQKQEILIDLLAHRRKHMAYLYGMETGVLNGQRPNGAMAPVGGNPTGIPGNPGGVQPQQGAGIMPPGQGGAMPGPAGGFTPNQPGAPAGILGLGKLDIQKGA